MMGGGGGGGGGGGRLSHGKSKLVLACCMNIGSCGGVFCVFAILGLLMSVVMFVGGGGGLMLFTACVSFFGRDRVCSFQLPLEL